MEYDEFGYRVGIATEIAALDVIIPFDILFVTILAAAAQVDGSFFVRAEQILGRGVMRDSTDTNF